MQCFAAADFSIVFSSVPPHALVPHATFCILHLKTDMSFYLLSIFCIIHYLKINMMI